MTTKYNKDLIAGNLRRHYGANIKSGIGKTFGRNYIEIGKKKIPIAIRNAMINEGELYRVAGKIAKETGNKREDIFRLLSEKPNFHSSRTPRFETLSLAVLAMFSVGIIVLISFRMNLITGFAIGDTLDKSSYLWIFLAVCVVVFLIIKKVFFPKKKKKPNSKKKK